MFHKASLININKFLIGSKSKSVLYASHSSILMYLRCILVFRIIDIGNNDHVDHETFHWYFILLHLVVFGALIVFAFCRTWSDERAIVIKLCYLRYCNNVILFDVVNAKTCHDDDTNETLLFDVENRIHLMMIII